MSDDISTNPVEADDVHVAAEAGVEHDEQLDADQQTPEGDLPQEQPPEEEYDEIEHEGAKHRIPKALKGAFLMQADYTRKTQEVADTRKALEQREQALAQQAEAQKADLKAHAQMIGLEDQIASYEDVDWAGWTARIRQAFAEGRSDEAMADQMERQAAWDAYQGVRHARDKLSGELQQRERERSSEAERERATRAEQAYRELARDIPGWGPAKAQELIDFATKDLGLDEQYVRNQTDPVFVKLAHLAMEGSRLKKAQTQAQTISKQTAVRPAAQVGGNAQGSRDPAAMTDAEWYAHEEERLKRKQARQGR